MRTAFSDAIVAAAKADPKVLLLTGDHGYALFDAFRSECPNQYINCGIAEQNMVGVAAGLAKAGYRPIVYGLSAFIPIRVLEQIKMDVCYEELPVTFVGDGAGVVYAQLGASHQSTEDIAALRAVPGITIYSPADRFELTACLQMISHAKKPAYLRMGKADLGDAHSAKLSRDEVLEPISVGQAQASSILFIATGSGVKLAQDTAGELGGANILSVPCLKPFPAKAIQQAALGVTVIAVFEEHAIDGGLGGLVAETLVGRYLGAFLRIGIEDRFTPFCGSYANVMGEHGLKVAVVAERVRLMLSE